MDLHHEATTTALVVNATCTLLARMMASKPEKATGVHNFENFNRAGIIQCGSTSTFCASGCGIMESGSVRPKTRGLDSCRSLASMSNHSTPSLMMDAFTLEVRQSVCSQKPAQLGLWNRKQANRHWRQESMWHMVARYPRGSSRTSGTAIPKAKPEGWRSYPNAHFANVINSGTNPYGKLHGWWTGLP